MNRAQAISQIAKNAEKLNDAQLEGLVALTSDILKASIFSTLPPAEKALLDAALDRLDQGQGMPGDEVFARLDAHISAARTRA